MMTNRIPLLLSVVLLVHAPALFAQSAVHVRIMPPNRAQFLQFQKFDVRVEAAAPEGTTLGDMRVTLDGRDITSLGTITGSANAKNWTLRAASLGIPGDRSLGATVSLQNSVAVVTSAISRIHVRTWCNARAVALAQQGSLRDLRFASPSRGVATPVNTGGIQVRLDSAQSSDDQAHGDAIDAVQPRAKNVILLIGDGMGAAFRTAARVLSKGYTQGKANGAMATENLARLRTTNAG